MPSLVVSVSSAAGSGSGHSWSGESNVFSSDNVDASVDQPNGEISDTLQGDIPAAEFNAIPAAATNFRFRIGVECARSGDSAIPYSVSATVANITEVFVINGSDTYWGVATPLSLSDVVRYWGDETDAPMDGRFGPPTAATFQSFDANIRFIARPTGGGSSTIFVDHMFMEVFYDVPNDAPIISVAPTVDYGELTRLGPNNTPAAVSFTATDADGDALTYEIRTAPAGGGTLVGNGSATSGVAEVHNIASSASGLVNGSQTLYLRVSDGIVDSADAAFTLLRDTTPPSVGAITQTPDPVVG